MITIDSAKKFVILGRIDIPGESYLQSHVANDSVRLMPIPTLQHKPQSKFASRTKLNKEQLLQPLQLRSQRRIKEEMKLGIRTLCQRDASRQISLSLLRVKQSHRSTVYLWLLLFLNLEIMLFVTNERLSSQSDELMSKLSNTIKSP